jgi:hypothetical protein
MGVLLEIVILGPVKPIVEVNATGVDHDKFCAFAIELDSINAVKRIFFICLCFFRFE